MQNGENGVDLSLKEIVGESSEPGDKELSQNFDKYLCSLIFISEMA